MITVARSGGPSSPLEASATSKFSKPASAGVSRTNRNDSTKNTASRMAGTTNSEGSQCVIWVIFGAQSNAR